MRAVNLIPADSRGRSSSRGPSTGMQIPVYVLLGVLAAAVALVTMYVLTNNSITSRKADLASLKTQVAQEQAAANRLGEFSKFSSLAQTRIGTVNSIASARFDWHTALVNLSKVVPADTTLQSIVGTVVPGASSGGAGTTSSLRSDIAAPAFDLTGCTANQDDVARLMSQLRLINGVTRVAFTNSQVSGASSSGSAGSTRLCGERSRLQPDGVLHACGQRRPQRRHRGERREHYFHHRRHPVTTRDRIVIMVVLALAAVAAGWMFVVSPKRSEASSLSTQVSSEQSQLTAVQGQVAAGMSARRQFAGQYAQLAKLGEAVPPDDDIPSLIYQVQSAAQASRVTFRGLQLTSAGASSSSSSHRARRRAARARPRRYPRERRSERPASRPSSSRSRSPATTSTCRASSTSSRTSWPAKTARS